MPQTITERAGTLTKPATGNRWRARLIESDANGKQGSSGYYPREVLERDGPGVFEAKPVYFDHPSETEMHDRPERSVRDLAGKIVSKPAMEADGLYADVEFYSWAAPIVSEMAGDIGMSIRASASVTAATEKGIRGPVITELHEAQSVDLVTAAGAGGKLVSLLESARHEGRAPVGEATASDTHDILNRAVRDAYGDHSDAWVSDYDPEEAVVYYSRRVDSRGDYQRATFRQGYTVANDGLTAVLTGTPTEVRARTEYVPVESTTDATETASTKPPVAPAGLSTTPTESEEDTMPNLSEADITALQETASRVQTVEETARAAEQRAEIAEAAALQASNREAAVTMIADSDHAFTALERRGLLADLPTGEDGTLDRDKFKDQLAEAAPAPTSAVRGFGATTTESTREQTVTEADLDTQLGITRKGA